MLIYKVSLLLCAVYWTKAISLPPEPKYPSTICSELKAQLKEKGGVLPEADESRPDTERLQSALDGCKGKNQGVKLVASEGNNAFLSGPLTLPTGVTLWIDSGVTLFASRNPRDYDTIPGACGILRDFETLKEPDEGCHPLIKATNTSNSGIVGDGVIDGRGGAYMTSGKNETWWELALEAQDLNSFQSCPRLIEVIGGSDFVVYRIRLHNSPYWTFFTDNLDGLIAWGVIIESPTATYGLNTHARNTDGFDPNGKNMVFTQCYINAGDDNIAIKGGDSRVENILIQDNHFYKGHGMSIGSEIFTGVVNVTVKNLSIDGADNGLRIKADARRGGTVSGIYFDNVCIRNTDCPLVFEAYYSSNPGTLYPDFQDIHVSNTHILSSNTKNVCFRGYDADYPLKIFLDNVVSDVSLSNITASDAELTLGPGAVTGIPVTTTSGNNIKINDIRNGLSSPVDCSNMFVPFPAYDISSKAVGRVIPVLLYFIVSMLVVLNFI